MAMTFQLASSPLPTDEVARNYLTAGNDIAAKAVVMIDASNIVGTAGDDIGVKITTTGGSVDFPYGVALETIVSSGSSARVRTAGRAVCVAHGSITAGDVVMVSATAAHAGQVKTQTPGNPQLGQALTSAADGEDVLVQLCIAKNS